MDNETGVGFELSHVHDDLAIEHDKYFLVLYPGVHLANTATYVRHHYAALIDKPGFIVLIPDDPGLSQNVTRKDNVKRIFGVKNAWLISEVIWLATPATLRSADDAADKLDDVPHFVGPKLENKREFAVDYVHEWLDFPKAPVLLVQGGGGIGKTTLVKYLKQELQKDNRLVVHIDALDISDEIRSRFGATNVTLYDTYVEFCRHLDQEPPLNEEQFAMNLDVGNIFVMLDGLDEIVARCSPVFDVSSFLRSTADYTGVLGKSKVLITTRASFHELLPQNREAASLEDYAPTLDLNVSIIELSPFEETQATAFFASRMKSPKQAMAALKLARQFSRSGQDKHIPYVLELIATHIDTDGFSDSQRDIVFSSDFLSQDIQQDYIVFKWCQREIGKYPKYPWFPSVDDQVRLFLELARRDGVCSEKTFTSFCRDVFGETAGTTASQTLKRHPLLRSASGDVRFRFDFFVEHFLNIHMGLLLSSRAKLDVELAKRLADYYWLGSQFVSEAAIRLGTLSDDTKLALLTHIEGVKDLEVGEDTAFKLSALFLNIALEIGQKHSYSSEQYTQLLHDFFFSKGTAEYVGVNLGGIRHTMTKKIVFDFQGKTFDRCRFEGYDFFWECESDEKTLFRNSEFASLMARKGVNTRLTAANFDNATCILDQECRGIIEAATQERETDVLGTSEDVRAFLRLFASGGRLVRPRSEDILKRKTAHRRALSGRLLEALIDEGYIVQKPNRSNKAYLINEEYRKDLEDFVFQAIARPCVQRLLRHLVEKR